MTLNQDPPCHRWIKACVPFASFRPPTAKQFVAVEHATSLCPLLAPSIASAVMLHAVPFQPSMSRWKTSGLLPAIARRPTAKHEIAFTQLTPASAVLGEPATVGVASSNQLVPFQRADMGSVPDVPTAMHIPVPAHATPDHFGTVAPGGVGLVTIDHAVPFQRSIKVVWVVPVFVDPTAKQVVGSGHATAWRALVVAPDGFGLVTIDHAVPFHRSMSVLVVEPVVENPTATQFVADVHLTERSRLDAAPATLGVDCSAHVEPFQRTATVRVPAFDALLVLASPTATHIVVVHDTECSCGELSNVVPFATEVKVVPLDRAIQPAWTAGVARIVLCVPTTKQLAAGRHATDSNLIDVGVIPEVMMPGGLIS